MLQHNGTALNPETAGCRVKIRSTLQERARHPSRKSVIRQTPLDGAEEDPMPPNINVPPLKRTLSPKPASEDQKTYKADFFAVTRHGLRILSLRGIKDNVGDGNSTGAGTFRL